MDAEGGPDWRAEVISEPRRGREGEGGGRSCGGPTSRRPRRVKFHNFRPYSTRSWTRSAAANWSSRSTGAPSAPESRWSSRSTLLRSRFPALERLSEFDFDAQSGIERRLSACSPATWGKGVFRHGAGPGPQAQPRPA